MHIIFQHAHPLPVKKYGGTERILFWLMKEYVRLGHRVSLIGHPHSEVSPIGVELISYQGEDFRKVIPKSADFLHLFYTPSYPLDLPYLVTIEGNGQPQEYFQPNTVFVSQKHAQLHGGRVFVHNALDLEEYPRSLFEQRLQNRMTHSSQQSWQDFLFLAKAKWKVKNLKGCCQSVKKAKKHLHVAGGRAWDWSLRIHSYGMVDQQQKQELFFKTDALLFPVRWHEPFGIAIIEAMAYGLPVIGLPYGSLPELIPSFAGFIVQNEQELVDVLSQTTHSFMAEDIRLWVEQHFNTSLMAQRYLALYEHVRQGHLLHPLEEKLRWRGDQAPTDLLTF
jgi:glycosyltransferase involved in cell wall biosynthesis